MSISILDRIIIKGFSIKDENKELVAMTIFLLCCKFNEAHQPSIRELNTLLYKEEDHQIKEYLTMEKDILELVHYNIWEDGEVYEELAKMELKYRSLPS